MIVINVTSDIVEWNVLSFGMSEKTSGPITFKWLMNAVRNKCTGKDPFKVQDKPTVFNLTVQKIHSCAFRFHIVNNL